MRLSVHMWLAASHDAARRREVRSNTSTTYQTVSPDATLIQTSYESYRAILGSM
jgi:hypothetical protein